MDPEDDARALVSELFPAARAAFLGGSVLSQRRTATSDLDIVLVMGNDLAPYRESRIWRQWPAELFVHQAETIGAWFAKDTARRRPTLARMCADGLVLADVDGAATAIRGQARAILAAGPPPVSADELDGRRYFLTDLLDDLHGSTDPGETVVICWNVLVQVAELAMLLSGNWLGSGKWLLRELRGSEPALAGELLQAREDPPTLSRVADDVLARAGGRLWAGYRQDGQL
jgi:hypothetical protein